MFTSLLCVIFVIYVGFCEHFLIRIIMADSVESRGSADVQEVQEESASVENQPSSSGEMQQQQHRGRKRSRNPENWKETICKKRRNEGKKYVSRSTGKVVEARKIGPECRDGCFDTVTRTTIEALFKEFWGIGNYDAQTSYLQKFMLPMPVKRHRTPADQSRRSTTIAYTVKYGDSEFKVCKQAFLSIFGIGEKRSRVALDKVTLGKTTVPDQRGRQPTATKFVGPKADLVREHIRMLPTMSSHYSRAKSKLRQYMDSNLTVKKLYDMYVEYMQKENTDVDIVSFNYYSNVFRLEFNIGFAPPKVDTCSTCDAFEASLRNLQQQGAGSEEANNSMQRLQEDLDRHRDLARIGRQLLDSFSVEGDDVMALCFDLQQTLPTPKLSTNVAYYKRKLWTYNLCIHNLISKKSTMYLWDEVTAKRGSCEIMSCLQHYVDYNHHENQTKLLLYSDNCAGQNKNTNVILGCLRLLHSKKFFRIEHRFLVPGHSYLPCDRHFGNIESRLRREATISGKPHYIRVVANAIQGGFEVVDMQQKDFLNFDVLQQHVTKRTSKTTTLQKARVIVYDASHKEGYTLKVSYDMEDEADQHPVKLQKGRAAAYNRKIFNLSEVAVPRRYNHPLPLTAEKLEDIKDLVKYVAPLEEQQYLQSVISGQNNCAEVASSEENPDPDDIDSFENVLDY